jgi:hypothetical protein
LNITSISGNTVGLKEALAGGQTSRDKGNISCNGGYLNQPTTLNSNYSLMGTK